MTVADSVADCVSDSMSDSTSRPSVTSADIARVFRDEHGRAVAVLIRALGDIDLAEDAVQDAFTVAVERWARDGMPPSPAGWIITTARRRAQRQRPRVAAPAGPCRRSCRAGR